MFRKKEEVKLFPKEVLQKEMDLNKAIQEIFRSGLCKHPYDIVEFVSVERVKHPLTPQNYDVEIWYKFNFMVGLK